MNDQSDQEPFDLYSEGTPDHIDVTSVDEPLYGDELEDTWNAKT